MTRHFLTLLDLTESELIKILDRADELRSFRGSAQHPKPLAGRSVAIIFDKASTRTRISFEVGVHELGALPVTLISKDTQIGRGEPLADTAKMLSRFVHAAVYRTFGHDRLVELAASSTIPIINGLSDAYHPCQLLADLMTVRQHVRKDLRGVKVTWIGDGNNMAHSWINAAARTGLSLTLACPDGYGPDPDVVATACEQHKADITLVRDPVKAAVGADVVTTDVWASMGHEGAAAVRQNAFKGFMVDEACLRVASADAIFLHCLPAHRGEEVAASVIDGPQSRVWDEAENRLHGQKALLEFVIAGG